MINADCNIPNIPTTSAKTYGINCKSVVNCKSGWYSTWGSYATWATDIRAMMDRIPDDVYVEPGDLIACRGLICAWVTGICEHQDCEAAIAEPVPRGPCDGSWDGVQGGMTMQEVKQKAQDLRDHECKVCGEVAASWPEDKTTKDVWCSGSLKISSPSDDLRFEHGCSTDGKLVC